MAVSDVDIAVAHLVQRLLTDSAFHARFVRDPAATCREAGFDDLADEMTFAAGKATDTLDARNSPSSILGVLMAAGMGGVGLAEALDHLQHAGDIPPAAGNVLTRHLQALHEAPPADPPRPHHAIEPAPRPQTHDAPEIDTAPARPAASPEALELVSNKNVVLDPAGVADLKAGRIDPRVVGVLTKLSHEHRITVSGMRSDHSRFTAGGTVSNHHFGRGADITAIDGVPVTASNFDAREIAMKLQDIDPSLRPDEIGTPWAIGGQGFFTDAAHQNHLHIGYKQDVAPEFKPPSDVKAPGDDVPAPAGGRSDTLSLLAAEDKPAAAGPAQHDTLSLLAVADQHRAAAPLGPVAYPGDDASKEQIAAWMAAEARKRGLPGELPIMASLVESGMRNLNFGDRDSVGFFQMRLGTWNNGPYAGYPEDPNKQLDWFLDQAEAVKKTRLANGQSVTDPHQYGDWIADVERPAEQFRGRYQLQYANAHDLLQHAPAPPATTSGPVDPSQFGADGTGGTPSREALALLSNKNVVLDSTGVADLRAGRIDPRVVAVLTKLSHDHKITISCMCSDHSKFTAGGSVSNHHFGRGADIAAIDGVPVTASNFDAREIAMELQDFDPSIRPNEIGTPWAIGGPGYFTDAAHQNHLHIGFKQAVSPDFKPPSDVAASGDVPAPGGAAAGGGSLGAAALRVAQTQHGVHEIGSSNTGPQVDKYLAAAGVAPGNPWCASFVTWSLEQAGHKMPGGGWAAVSTWVHNAEQGSNGLKVVSASEARPGDIVAYDWGGQSDFGADGHIGFLASKVDGGAFTALEGNNADAVNSVPRHLGGGPNIVFIRVAGDAPGGVPGASPGDQVAPAKGDTLQLLAPGAKPASTGPARHDTLSLIAAQDRKPAPGAAELAPAGPVDYPGDDASKEQIAAWMAAEARKRGLPGELPVMASLVESGMRNLNYGDRDSVGFFQMRTTIWNSGPYAGYPDDPQKQIAWFLDRAEAVKKTRLANGQSIDDPQQYGNWVADIEQPAEQFRYRYQLQYDNAHGLLQHAPAGPPADVAGDLVPGGAGGAGAKALIAVAEAKKYLGTPYQWGGSTPQTGFDCSGLMQWAYAHAGISIPRVSEAQILASNATPVDRQHLLPGDLVFFRDASGDVHHVGMSLGGDQFIHAPHTGDVVKISSLKEPYYAEQFTGGHRFVPAGAGPAPDPTDVANAHVHVARDAVEVRRHDSVLFMAVKAQEAAKAHATVQFLKAIDPEQAKAAARGGVAAPELQGGQAPVDLAGVSSDYPGDDASQAALAKWLASRAEKAGLPPELPVMAALVDSDVKNLNFGDRDSVGFFQMRVGTWDKGPYAGYPQRPELQAKWFIDQALDVKRRRVADGNVAFGKDPSKWGEWIADIERPAEQYRGRYQLRLAEARKLLA